MHPGYSSNQDHRGHQANAIPFVSNTFLHSKECIHLFLSDLNLVLMNQSDKEVEIQDPKYNSIRQGKWRGRLFDQDSSDQLDALHNLQLFQLQECCDMFLMGKLLLLL